ncbi:MAG: AsmA family protein, partial [Acidobacteria bacterium]|nr:AsmA family protein [Acidobacteriota bacterium]
MMRRRQKILAGFCAAILIILTLTVRSLLNIDRYRPKVVEYLQGKLGKQVEIGHLTLKLLPLSLVVENFGVKNPAVFPSGYVVKVGRIDALLDWQALFRGLVVIRSLTLDHPVINLISDPDGPWNFQNPEAKASQRTFPLGLIYRVDIKHGELTASTLLASDAPGPVFFAAHDIDTELDDVNVIGIISLSSSSSSDGRGTLRAHQISFGAIQGADLTSALLLQARRASFTDVKTRMFSGDLSGALSFDLSGKDTVFETNIRFKDLDAEPLLLAFGSDQRKVTGRMEGNLTLSGTVEHSIRPLAGVRGKGHIILREGEVPTLQL